MLMWNINKIRKHKLHARLRLVRDGHVKLTPRDWFVMRRYMGVAPSTHVTPEAWEAAELLEFAQRMTEQGADERWLAERTGQSADDIESCLFHGFWTIVSHVAVRVALGMPEPKWEYEGASAIAEAVAPRPWRPASRSVEIPALLLMRGVSGAAIKFFAALSERGHGSVAMEPWDIARASGLAVTPGEARTAMLQLEMLGCARQLRSTSLAGQWVSRWPTEDVEEESFTVRSAG